MQARGQEVIALRRAHDPVEDLRLILDVQRRIAQGKVKGASAAQQTQAARAYAELLPLLHEQLRARDETAFDLSKLTDRIDLLRLVVGASPARLTRLRDLVTSLPLEEEGEGDDDPGEGVNEGAV